MGYIFPAVSSASDVVIAMFTTIKKTVAMLRFRSSLVFTARFVLAREALLNLGEFVYSCNI